LKQSGKVTGHLSRALKEIKALEGGIASEDWRRKDENEECRLSECKRNEAAAGLFTIFVPDVDRFWRGFDDTPQSHVVPQRHAHNLIVHRYCRSD
jgi:hypothetical protein